MRPALSGLALVAALLTGCGGDGDEGADRTIVLDGSPRVPDAEGVVVDVAEDLSSVTLDGDRTYAVSDDLQSFATADGATRPLLAWESQYAQVGLDGDTVVWIAGVGAVGPAAGGGSRVFYTGVLTRIDAGRATFRDGTVLVLADGVTLPGSLPAAVVATIDADSHEVSALELQR